MLPLALAQQSLIAALTLPCETHAAHLKFSLTLRIVVWEARNTRCSMVWILDSDGRDPGEHMGELIGLIVETIVNGGE